MEVESLEELLVGLPVDMFLEDMQAFHQVPVVDMLVVMLLADMLRAELLEVILVDTLAVMSLEVMLVDTLLVLPVVW
jgi:hypothetical protein